MQMKMNFVSVKSTELLYKYFGETENTIRSLFRKARAAAPCVLFFDDFDTLAHKRYGAPNFTHFVTKFVRYFGMLSQCRSAADSDDASTSNGLHGRILSTFLNELDGIVVTSKAGEGGPANGSEAQQVLVIAACRDLTALDEALIRPGQVKPAFRTHCLR
jgi:SpoVK/Ycf46/Vps4 family AAA+-type ATPase